MNRTIFAAGAILAFVAPAGAQESEPSTWRDPDTRCVYLKINDTLSLRYRRDGSPDCASVPQVSVGTSITRDDFRELSRAIESLRRDVGAVRREIDRLQPTR